MTEGRDFFDIEASFDRIPRLGVETRRGDDPASFQASIVVELLSGPEGVITVENDGKSELR
ncbi:MAG: hypothetical protein JOZ15_04840 [Acidobacteria bacterium]|nr:hypothetical protein [Acidobacteriota bacterium]